MAQAARDAKAEELVVLNLQKLSYSFDYFFLCSASSDRRVKTIAEQIREALSDRGMTSLRVEGLPESGWVLLDCGPVVGHIFSPEARSFYALERLWADAPRVPLSGKTLSLLKRRIA